jgi:hypothetical protein
LFECRSIPLNFSTDFPGNASDFRTTMWLPHRPVVVMVVAWSCFARDGREFVSSSNHDQPALEEVPLPLPHSK